MQTVKMVITGPFSAGKTEFIRSISEIEVVSTDQAITSAAEKEVKSATTVAMDFGRITVDDDLVLYLFGTPGQRRFDFMWEILAEGMLGFVVMVDSAKPETFREAKSILETFRAYAPTPYVVAANKQDHPDHRNDVELRVKQDQRQHRANSGRRKGGQDRERMDVTLVKHSERDVDGRQGCENQKRLVGERLLKYLGGAGKLAADARRHADPAHRGFDCPDRGA